MDTSALSGLDSFPYRHRIHEVMSSPVAQCPAEANLGDTSRRMHELGVSSLVVMREDGRPAGIVTERDIIRLIGQRGAAALSVPVAQMMSSPVSTVPRDAFVYLALGRMDRSGFRHLVVVDEDGRAIGVITGRALLRLRVGQALALGDRLAGVQDAAEMRSIQQNLPTLARHLLAEQVSALTVAGVISAVLRDMTARAAELAEIEMREAGWGEAPAPWSLLVLGSGGRGESLLAPDQDNAIVHQGQAADDAWFAELGRRVSDALDQAGIPYCKGGVMASREGWRRSLEGWREELRRWARQAEGESILNVDIFYDFKTVWGNLEPGRELRDAATEIAAKAPMMLRMLAQGLESKQAPLGFFGRIRTVEGRVDVKAGALFPLTCAVRVMALRHRIAATGTGERLEALVAAGAVKPAEAERLLAMQDLIARLMLEQQLTDLAEGRSPGTRVDPRRLTRPDRTALRDALRHVATLELLVRDALTG